jgi:hypothetical protein
VQAGLRSGGELRGIGGADGQEHGGDLAAVAEAAKVFADHGRVDVDDIVRSELAADRFGDTLRQRGVVEGGTDRFSRQRLEDWTAVFGDAGHEGHPFGDAPIDSSTRLRTSGLKVRTVR